ncbi:GlsB/YeaQ/YmgE family stress response membrane protein [Suttonella sp. R2A3]|uniref:GlsB/YeaQ/YmgE family stress response membrane protein n=1 Tax=Suttonella sp. R2A3 TaxID=2908648 RepID=UPI001F227AE7|nr:GlsB/YeaQ/YmgE family stress response membrane protein [Suttonella sp. R2A3]UJF24040.1 GlsB/YeaQ/YmgE family stress response membrane protein [Suttonella sp. R2A3]
MMDLLAMLVIGFIAGLLARAIFPGDDKLGCFLTIGLGIAGSFVAGFIGRGLGWYSEGEPVGFIMSVLGAILILFIYNKVKNPR